MANLTSVSGAAYPHSLSVRYKITSNHWRNFRKKYNHIENLSWKDIQWDKCSLEEKQSILLYFHEQDHVIAYLSSPFGLLMWRCNQVLYIGAQWFLSKIELAGINEISTPVDHWYLNYGGKKLIQNAILNGRLPEYLNVTVDGKKNRMSTIEKLDSVCEEIDSTRELINILLGNELNTNISIGEFIDIANKAYKYIFDRSGLNHSITWNTRLNKAHKLYNLKHFLPINGRFMIETSARIREEDCLLSMKADINEFNTWKKHSLNDVYGKVYDGLNKVGLNSIPARNIIWESLRGIIDPACISKSMSKIYIEDTLPWIRLDRLVDAFNKSGIDKNLLKIPYGLQFLVDYANLNKPYNPFKLALENDFFSEKARWTKSKYTSEAQNDFDYYYDLVMLITQKNFRIHFDAQSYYYETGIFKELNIENPPSRFKDGFDIRNIPQPDGLTIQIMRIWRQMIDEYFIKGFIYGEPVESPMSIRNSVLKGIRKFVSINNSNLNPELVNKINDLFSLVFLKNFGFGNVGINSLCFYNDL